MTRKNIHPAVFATLSTSLFMLPTTAYAATALDTVKSTLISSGPSCAIYAIGMLAGASLYHAVYKTRAVVRKESDQMKLAFQTAGHSQTPRHMSTEGHMNAYTQSVPSEEDAQSFEASSSIVWSTQDNVDYEEIAERYIQMTSTQNSWQETLSAIDERAQESENLSLIDIVDDSDMLDEPEGLEPPTLSISFEAPAGHPEIVDTDSYVDYLIRDEFARNSSKAAQRSSQSFLKVIEGGSQVMPRLSAQAATKQAPSHAARKPRHFAHSIDYDVARQNARRKQGPRHFAHSIAIEA